MTCYNCNSPYHYSDKCPKPKKVISCFNCNKTGHYKKDCPDNVNRNPEGINLSIQNNNNFLNNVRHSEGISPNSPNNTTILYKILLDGMWGKNSCYVQKDSLLANIKQYFIDLLLESKIITLDDLDIRNQICHIDIKGDKNLYDMLNNMLSTLTYTSFILDTNTIEIVFGDINLHCTMIYKKDLRKLLPISLYDTMLQKIITKFKNTEHKSDTENKNDDVNANLCVICEDENKDCLISPCNHASICMKCSNKINKCPICRVNITERKKIYIN